jgi:hypothetical protein
MFDLKISGIAAGTAFIVSLLLGMISGASFPALIIRPLLFAVLFFVAAAFVYFLVSHFLPELLEGDGWQIDREDEIPHSGSRVNITEEEPPAEAFFAAQPDDSEDNLGDISDLMSASMVSHQIGANSPGLDQHSEDKYTRDGDFGIPADLSGGGFAGGGNSASRTSPVSGSADFMDALPDLDSLAGAFLPNSGEDAADTTEYSTSAAPAKGPQAGSKGQKMEGDFNPKELAAGIRTILKKEG